MKTSTLRNQNILATFRRHSPWLILMMVMLLTTGFARALGADMTSLIVDRLETGGEGLGLLILVVCLGFLNRRVLARLKELNLRAKKAAARSWARWWPTSPCPPRR